MEEGIESSIRNLWRDVRELQCTPPYIDHLPAPPTPLQFLRDYVSQNKPCLISSAVAHWNALSSWPSTAYLRRALSTALVSLHLTPTGKADSLVSHPTSTSSLCFASAHVQTLPFPKALDLVLASNEEKMVAYLQQQNDCFRSEYGPLAGDCEEHIPWASEALGCLPEAVNLWIGNHLSETSFHKDHYENLYIVISGEKRFLLLPPSDVHRMYIREYPTAHYQFHEDSGEFTLELDDPISNVPWCSVDPFPSPKEKQREIVEFPLYFDGPQPYEVTVKAGEMLYLPSMWFHHVRQTPDDTGLTIAINYWYDMQFDIKHAYFMFLQSIPYPVPNNVSLLQMKNLESNCGRSLPSSGDESDIIMSQVDDNEEER